jgi:hypothetical protein
LNPVRRNPARSRDVRAAHGETLRAAQIERRGVGQHVFDQRARQRQRAHGGRLRTAFAQRNQLHGGAHHEAPGRVLVVAHDQIERGRLCRRDVVLGKAFGEPFDRLAHRGRHRSRGVGRRRGEWCFSRHMFQQT